MPAKYWLLPLLAVAVLALAGHGPAQGSTEQFVVTYVEFLPAKQDPGEQLVEQLASIKLSAAAPTINGNQPPSGILCRLAKTKVKSSARNKPATGSKRCKGQRHTPRATVATSTEVTSMSPATAMGT